MPVIGYRSFADFAKDFESDIVENKEVIEASVVEEKEKGPQKPTESKSQKKRRRRKRKEKSNAVNNETTNSQNSSKGRDVKNVNKSQTNKIELYGNRKMESYKKPQNDIQMVTNFQQPPVLPPSGGILPYPNVRPHTLPPQPLLGQPQSILPLPRHQVPPSKSLVRPYQPHLPPYEPQLPPYQPLMQPTLSNLSHQQPERFSIPFQNQHGQSQNFGLNNQQRYQPSNRFQDPHHLHKGMENFAPPRFNRRNKQSFTSNNYSQNSHNRPHVPDSIHQQQRKNSSNNFNDTQLRPGVNNMAPIVERGINLDIPKKLSFGSTKPSFLSKTNSTSTSSTTTTKNSQVNAEKLSGSNDTAKEYSFPKQPDAPVSKSEPAKEVASNSSANRNDMETEQDTQVDFEKAPTSSNEPEPKKSRKIYSHAAVNLAIFVDQITDRETSENNSSTKTKKEEKKQQKEERLQQRQHVLYDGVLTKQHVSRFEKKQAEKPENNPLLGQWEEIAFIPPARDNQQTHNNASLLPSDYPSTYSQQNFYQNYDNSQLYNSYNNQMYNQQGSSMFNQANPHLPSGTLPPGQVRPGTKPFSKPKHFYPSKNKKLRGNPNNNFENWQLRERPPVNDEDIRKNFFFLDPNGLAVLKNFTLNERTKTPDDAEKLARFQARFQYYFTFKNFSFAKKQAKEKPAFLRIGNPYGCDICDMHFKTPSARDEHLKSNFHEEMSVLVTTFRKFVNEFYKSKTVPGYEPGDDIKKMVKEGLHVDTSKNVEEKSQEENISEFSHVSLDDLDVSLSVEDFTIAACDKLMENYWIKPNSEYFCQVCNFKTFRSATELQMHERSPNHKESAMNFSKSWCAVCQFNNYTEEKMKVHLASERHLKVQSKLDEAKLISVNYWNENHEKAVIVVAEKRKIQELEEKHAEEEKYGNASRSFPENARFAYSEAYTSQQYNASNAVNYQYQVGNAYQYYSGSNVGMAIGYYDSNVSEQAPAWWYGQP